MFPATQFSEYENVEQVNQMPHIESNFERAEERRRLARDGGLVGRDISSKQKNNGKALGLEGRSGCCQVTSR